MIQKPNPEDITPYLNLSRRRVRNFNVFFKFRQTK